MREPYEISQVISLFKASLAQRHSISTKQMHVLNALEKCRTAALGGHVDACPECGSIQISYNSCRNRHCPKCQGFEREKWIAARKEELLPVKYFHVVFTLPDVLNPTVISNQKMSYSILFKAAWETVNTFARNQGVQAGMIALLHTWGSNLSYHPHLHCIIAAGGVTPEGKWKSFAHAFNNSPFLFSVKGMSRMFRAKFTAMLDKHLQINQQTRKAMFAKEWVVYSKHPFNASEMVVEYIGRYSHRVAIANSRITAIDDENVSFTYKDYREKGVTKTMTLTGVEFLRRFTMHILPSGFVKIRHYGYLSSSNREKLRAVQKEMNLPMAPIRRRKKSWSESYMERFGVSHRLCRHCGKAEMLTIHSFSPTSRPPPFSVFKSSDCVIF
jgi:hypothetical protein